MAASSVLPVGVDIGWLAKHGAHLQRRDGGMHESWLLAASFKLVVVLAAQGHAGRCNYLQYRAQRVRIGAAGATGCPTDGRTPGQSMEGRL